MTYIIGAIATREYKGYYIEGFKDGHWEVDYCGDIVVFNSDLEARDFIDSLEEE